MTCLAPCPGVELLDESAFLDHAAGWNRLLQRSYDNRIFLTAAWFRLWWTHFGVGHAHVAAARAENGELSAALPLRIVENDGQRVLTLLGDPNVADYMDGLAEKAHAEHQLEGLWRCALQELPADRLELDHVPSTSALIPALQSAAGQRGWQMTVADDEVCPVAILCSTWDGYLSMLTKKQRHEIRRKLRRAEEDVDWSWRTVRTHEELRRDLPVYFRLHEAGSSDKSGFMTPAMRAYFTDLTSEMLDLGYLRLSVFRREGVDIAASIGFLYRDRYLLYNSGYDPEFAVYSPGIAAVAHAMQDAIEEKAVAFDFLSGDEPYKYQFGATNTYTCRISASRI
jgi:CelD/BcsL family acetyltransferase involved in cellulose biosynthesis